MAPLDRKTYTIIAGVNGCGKSSLSGTKKDELGFIVDVKKIAKLNKVTNIAAGRIGLEQINTCLDKGVSFAQETTLSGHLTAKTAKQAKNLGFYIRMFYVGLDNVNDSLERIHNRVKRGGHDIPQTVVIRRFEDRIPSLIKVLPYCDEVIFFDNNNGFEPVAIYLNKEIVITTKNPPNWIQQFSSEITPDRLLTNSKKQFQ